MDNHTTPLRVRSPAHHHHTTMTTEPTSVAALRQRAATLKHLLYQSGEARRKAARALETLRQQITKLEDTHRDETARSIELLAELNTLLPVLAALK